MSNPKSLKYILKKSDDITDPTPRQKASKDTIDQLSDTSEYKYARKSKIKNQGEDIAKSARHIRGQWKGLEDSEASGTADKMVTLKNMQKFDPLDIIPAPGVHSADSHIKRLAAQAIINKLPNQPEKVSAGSDGLRVIKRKDMKNWSSVPKSTAVPDDHEVKDYSTEDLQKMARSHYVKTYQMVKDLLQKHVEDPGVDMHKMVKDVRAQVLKHVLDSRANPDPGFQRATHNHFVNFVNNGLSPTGRKKTSATHTVSDFIANTLKSKGIVDRDQIKQLIINSTGKNPNATEVPGQFTFSDELAGHLHDPVMQYLEGKPISKIFPSDKPNTKRTFNHESLYGDSSLRSGPEMSDKHEDHESAILKDMKLRGLQYGNSVTDSERSHHVKNASMALQDLTRTLGLPKEMASFNGRLGLAIGARGKGGALAHYEPDLMTINLTRKGGTGSLAHEWAHFFDHILNKTTMDRDGFASAAMNGSWDFRKKNYKNEDHEHVTPVYQAMSEISKYFDNHLAPRMRKDYRNDEVAQKQIAPEKLGNYWFSDHEMFARAFEGYLHNKMKQKGEFNHYLTKHPNHFLWLKDDEVKHLTPYFDKLFDSFKTSKYLKKSMDMMSPLYHVRFGNGIRPKQETSGHTEWELSKDDLWKILENFNNHRWFEENTPPMSSDVPEDPRKSIFDLNHMNRSQAKKWLTEIYNGLEDNQKITMYTHKFPDRDLQKSDNKDQLPGGKGDKKTDKDFSKKEVAMGHKVEAEHTSNPKIAAEVTRDHLSEKPNYYSKLKEAGLADELEKGKSEQYQIHPEYTLTKKPWVEAGNYYGKPRDYWELSHSSNPSKFVGRFLVDTEKDPVMSHSLVDKKHRNKGLGSAVYLKLANHYGSLFSDTTKTSRSAKRVWEKIGGVPTGDRNRGRQNKERYMITDKEAGLADELEKARGDYKNNNYSFYHLPNPKDPKKFVVYASDGGSSDAGYAKFRTVDHPKHGKVLMPDDAGGQYGVHVEREHRRQGLATGMYEHAEKVTGLKIVPSEFQSPGGENLWSPKDRTFGKALQKTHETNAFGNHELTTPHSDNLVHSNKVTDKIDHHVHETGSGTTHSLVHVDQSGKRHVLATMDIYQHSNEDRPYIAYSQVNPKFTGKGFGKALYLQALKHHGSLRSDTHTSQNANKAWEWLGKQPNVSVKMGTPGTDESHVASYTELKKSEDLEKGVARKIAPYSPPQGQTLDSKFLNNWTTHEDTSTKNALPRHEGAIRFRALNKLAARTKTRVNPETKEKEYLLHRGMSAPEFDNGNQEKSSWTPRLSTAISFGSTYADDDPDYQGRSHVVSAWIPEKHMHNFPFMHSHDPSIAAHASEYEVVVNPHRLQEHISGSPTEMQKYLKTTGKLSHMPVSLPKHEKRQIVRKKVEGNLGKSEHQNKWRRPTDQELNNEHDWEYRHVKGSLGDIFPTKEHFKAATQNAKIVPMPDMVERATDLGSVDDVKDMVSEYQFPRDVDRIVGGLKDPNVQLPAPIVVKHKNRHFMMGGNTRQNLAKIHGITPHVLLVDTDQSKDKLAKGLRGDWQKEGYTLHVIPSMPLGTPKAKFDPKQHGYIVQAKDKDGKYAGSASIEHKGGNIIPYGITISEQHRRKGLASGIYKHAQELSGKKIVPEYVAEGTEPAGQSGDAKALWNQPNRPFGKSLKKGVMRLKAPYSPKPDDKITDAEDNWIKWGDSPAREKLPEHTSPIKDRALNKIMAQTKTRKNNKDEREFLLYRGMSEDEYLDHKRGDVDNHTSWTPKLSSAAMFSSSYGRKHKIMSAWIPESQMHHFPFMLSHDPEIKSDFRNEMEVVIKPHKVNMDSQYSVHDADKEKENKELPKKSIPDIQRERKPAEWRSMVAKKLQAQLNKK